MIELSVWAPLAVFGGVLILCFLAHVSNAYVSSRTQWPKEPTRPPDGFKPSPSATGIVEGRVRKGGINQVPSQVIERPPAPGPTRRTSR